MKSEKSIAPYHPFIVGSARSGTTLLRMMLDSHPDMAIPPETHFIDALMQLNQDADNFYRDFCYKITGFFTWPDMEAYVSKSDFQQAIFKNADNLTFENGLKIFYDLYAKSQKKKYWGDKTPQYLLIMDKIEHLISDVAFIHIVRDVRDVCLSTSKVWFSKGSIDEHAFQWVESIKLAQLQSKKIKHYLEVRYEDLVLEPEATLRKICTFINLDYHSQMLSYYESAEEKLDNLKDWKNPNGGVFATKEMRKTVHANVDKPPDSSLIGQWKKSLTNEQIKTINDIACHYLLEFGYEV